MQYPAAKPVSPTHIPDDKCIIPLSLATPHHKVSNTGAKAVEGKLWRDTYIKSNRRED